MQGDVTFCPASMLPGLVRVCLCGVMFARLSRFGSSSNAFGRHFSAHLRVGNCRTLLLASDAKSAFRVPWPPTQSHSRLSVRACAADGEHDTIAALSSGSGRCGVALLRVSGPRTDDVLQSVLPSRKHLPAPRQATVSNIHHPATQELLDRAVLLRFPGPRSFTGEDVAELHVHGGPAVVRAVLDALCSIDGVRLADPGEFTRRAFEMGKVDLTEAEGLADLLSAETEAQRKQALKQSTGAQRQQYESWRRILLQCLANVEAVIDFGEDEGIAEEVAEQVLPRVQQLGQQLQQHLVNDRRGELVRSGVRAAIVGAPNVGKSSILNHLAGRKAAIVSAIPGTTRDAIEVVLDIAGYKVIITDTAGMRETLDPVEAEGVAVAHATAQQADLVLSVLDCTTYLSTLLNTNANPTSSKATIPTRDPDSSSTESSQVPFGLHTNAITVYNKADALSSEQRQRLKEKMSGQLQGSLQHAAPVQTALVQTAPVVDRQLEPDTVPASTASKAIAAQQQAARDELMSAPSTGGLKTVLCSCKTGWNMDVLVNALEQGVRGIMESGSDSQEGLVITRARHRQHVEECTAALQRYADVHLQLELAAEELRAAAKALGRVTGAIDTEDLLDAIFIEFCIGK